MNQDQVKEKLLAIEDAPLDFSVIFSGKKSKSVNGLYKPDTREIILHNRNFTTPVSGEKSKQKTNGASLTVDDNQLMYTAIHEYAHHLHACARGGHLSAKAHTAEFWAILHELLEKAEKKKIYQNVFTGSSEKKESQELEKLTSLIREKYLLDNGNLVIELGKLLLKAQELCYAIGGRYEDYIDRVLCIPRQAANVAVRMYQYKLNPKTGPDNMRFLAGIPNEEKRKTAENALLKGKTPAMVKTALKQMPKTESDDIDPKTLLQKEKLRLERTIATLSNRLDEVVKELAKA